MKIGLIADTHIAQEGVQLPSEVLCAFRDVQLILHAGDIYALSVLDQLETLAPVVAVRGYPDPRTPDRRLADGPSLVEIEGVRVGLVHDINWPGPPIKFDKRGSLELRGQSLENALMRKFGSSVDVVVFGDTHEPIIVQHENKLLVNPGSPAFPASREREQGTVGILYVSGKKVWATIAELRDFRLL